MIYLWSDKKYIGTYIIYYSSVNDYIRFISNLWRFHGSFNISLFSFHASHSCRDWKSWMEYVICISYVRKKQKCYLLKYIEWMLAKSTLNWKSQSENIKKNCRHILIHFCKIKTSLFRIPQNVSFQRGTVKEGYLGYVGRDDNKSHLE